MLLQTGTTVDLHVPYCVVLAIYGYAVEGIFVIFDTTHMPDEGGSRL